MEQLQIDSLAPFPSLPTELICVIFVLSTLPPRPINPLFLTLICKAWRSTALATPLLWTSFTHKVNPDREDSAKLSTVLAKMPEWLRRATTLPLTITLDLPQSSIDDIYALRKVVRPFMPRLQHIELISESAGIVIDSIPAGVAEELQSVVIIGLGYYFRQIVGDPHFFTKSGKMLEGVPKLRRAAFQSASFRPLKEFVTSIPWTQLTHLCFGSIEIDKWLQIFPRCTMLQSGSFYVTGEPEGTRSTVGVAPMTFSHLVDLTLVFRYASRLKPLFIFPKLISYRTGHTNEGYISMFFHQQLTSMRILSLFLYSGMLPSDVGPFFSVTPLLTCLDIELSVRLITPLFTLLEALTNSPDILPHLNALCLAFKSILKIPFSPETLLPFVKARFGGTHSHEDRPQSGFKRLIIYRNVMINNWHVDELLDSDVAQALDDFRKWMDDLRTALTEYVEKGFVIDFKLFDDLKPAFWLQRAEVLIKDFPEVDSVCWPDGWKVLE